MFLSVWSQDIVTMNSITVATATYSGSMKNVQVSKIPSNAPQFGFYLHIFIFLLSVTSRQSKGQMLHRAVCMFQSGTQVHGCEMFFLKVEQRVSEQRFPVFDSCSPIRRNVRANSTLKALERRTNKDGTCLAISVIRIISLRTDAFFFPIGTW